MALIVFNRPDLTAEVLKAIRKVRPQHLLVVSDGPRPSRLDDLQQVQKVREVVVRGIDWECAVETRFQETNLGCGRGVSSGLDWVFSRVEEAIILEDDCVPSASFFSFCQELLARYRHDERVGMITGDNFQFGEQVSEASYYFSRNICIWGWATWRRAWRNYDFTITEWPALRDAGFFQALFSEKKSVENWTRLMDAVHTGRIDTWDYQWMFACWRNHRMSIVPERNLVRNIGCGEGATHTLAQSVFSRLEAEELPFPIRHPRNIWPNFVADRRLERRHLSQHGIAARARRSLGRLFSKR